MSAGVGPELPAPDVVSAAAMPVCAATPARPLDIRVFPVRELPDQSPAGRNAPRAGGTPGAATPGPGLPPPGAAAPGTSRPPGHRPAQRAVSCAVSGWHAGDE